MLPVIALALPPLAYIARLTRGSMLEVLRSHFIRTAIAKGLPLHTVILRHALRPALVPVAGYLAPAVASIMTGSLVVEIDRRTCRASAATWCRARSIAITRWCWGW